MKHKPVMFDLDGVLVDFTVGFTSIAARLFPDKAQVVRAHQQPSYKWALESKEVDQVWREIDKDPLFWLNLPPLVDDWVFKEIGQMSQWRPVYFVTARPDYAKSDTEHWLLSQGWYLETPTVVMTKNKGEFAKAVGAGWSIEDKASNASMISWLTNDKTASYLSDRPYNAAPAEFLASGVRRIYKVEEYLEAICGE